MSVVSAAVWAADTTTGGGEVPWADLLKIGITPVVVVVLLMTSQLYIGKVVDKERKNERELWQKSLDATLERATKAEARADASEERERRLRDAAEEKFLPILKDAESTMQRILDYLIGVGGARR